MFLCLHASCSPEVYCCFIITFFDLDLPLRLFNLCDFLFTELGEQRVSALRQQRFFLLLGSWKRFAEV